MKNHPSLRPLSLAAAALTLAASGCGGGSSVLGDTGGTSSSGDTGSAGSGAAGAGAGSAASSSGGGGAHNGPYCGDGHLDPGEGCDDANNNNFDGCLPDCTSVKPIDAPPLKWTYYEVPGTKCMNGETAGFGVSLNPDSKDVMIYLEGGGACFNDACDFSTFSVPFIPPPDGIFNRNNVVNPVKNWNMVYVPYCSGDIHAGDKDSMLAGKVRYFHGYRNIGKFLEQWVPAFAGAKNILLTGISAGGFGAGLNAQQVADAFGPGPQLTVIDDSGPPLSNKVIAPCLQEVFRDVWGLDQTFLAACGADCPDKSDFASGWIGHVMKAYPSMRFGVFSNTADLVIRTFMGFGWGNGQLDNCGGTAQPVPAKAYEDDLLALRADYKERAGSFLIGPKHFEYNFGQNHTVLRSPTFWTTIIDGVSVPAWVGGVLDGKIQHVGP